jgi:hypothetical protein
LHFRYILWYVEQIQNNVDWVKQTK